MERSHRPPPLTLTPPHSRHTSISKASTKGRSSTTTISIREDEWNTGRWRTILRVGCDFAHILLCMVLALIMAFFVSYDDTVVSESTGSTAIFLMVLLALDTILDFQSIARYDKMWRGWALAGRTVIATGYAAIFAAHVATGGAFPEGYVYWGLGVEYSGPLVYVLLWVLGVWDLVFCAISRKQYVRELRRYRDAIWGPSGKKGKSGVSSGKYRDLEKGTSRPGRAAHRR